MPQDVVVVEDVVDRVARVIFAYRWPKALWSDPLWKAERADCVLLAAQFREIFRVKWTIQNAPEQLAAQFIQLAYGDRPLTPEQRAQVSCYAESCIEDFVPLFTGDSRSWRYVPEDEPDESEIEVIQPQGAN